jgi:hypothetical protein
MLQENNKIEPYNSEAWIYTDNAFEKLEERKIAEKCYE